jgi:glyoxylase-like metal-dependent hydrolase (beta-lactamase superfamily II)
VSGPALPASVRVIVRDWLNANHVVLLSEAGAELIDTGHLHGIAATLRHVDDAIAGRPLRRILLTHCHSDHMGGCARLRARHGCPIAVPRDDAPAVRAWDTRALWLEYAGQVAEPFPVNEELAPGDRLHLGDLDWEVMAAPGHDMGAVVFWQADYRLLISGDALWENGIGVLLPGGAWRERCAAARDTLLRLRALGARVVIPGHGAPFDDANGAIDRSLARLAALGQDERRLARHVLQVMLVYALLQEDAVAEETARGRFAAVPMFAEYAREYFASPADTVVSETLEALLAKGAVLRDSAGMLRARH